MVTFGLIVAGALVTSHDAGLAVPDWPTSFGSLYKIPPMVGGVKWEHGHRMVAQFVGFLTIIMAVWTWRVDKRRWMRALAWSALGLVIFQGILGGITVLFFLPWYISTAHAAFAQTFFSVTVLMALFTSRRWMEAAPARAVDGGAPAVQHLAIFAVASLYVQLFTGAGFRHSGFGFLPHLVTAVLVTAALLWVITRVLSQHSSVRELKHPALAMMSLLVAQLGLGFAAYLTRVEWGRDAVQPMPSMVASTVAHVATGALLLATSFVLAVQAHRHTARAPEAAGASRKAVTA